MPFQVTCIAGDALPARIVVDGPLEIGRDPHCDLRLVDEVASRFHARLRPGADCLVLEDNRSANGTWVAGRRVDRCDLRDGAVFACGGVQFAVGDLAASAADTRVVADDGLSLAVTRRQKLAAWRPGDDPRDLPFLHECQRLLSGAVPFKRAQVLAELAGRVCQAPMAAAVIGGAAHAQGMSERLARRLAGGTEARLLVLGRELVGHTIAAEAVGSAASAPLAEAGHLVIARGLDAEALGRNDLERLALLAAEASGFFAEVGRADDGGLVGDSALMRTLRTRVRRVASSDAPVLITGESGTGKELVANLLHRLSGRSAGPYVAVNCAAIAESLFESELFGHEKGAFTGADSSRPGRIRAAEGGTCFLDEIGELPPAMQAKLLRVVQQGTVEPVGGAKPIAVHVRFLAATNRDLAAEVEAGRFREDLFYRLDVLRVHCPALREHPEDIPAIARHVVATAAVEAGLPAPILSPGALRFLHAQTWPGNVRQLASILTRAVLQCEGRIEVADLELPTPRPTTAATTADAGRFLTLAEVEARHVAAALARTSWNKSAAARLLGISRPTLLKKIGDYGLEQIPGGIPRCSDPPPRPG